MVKVPDNLKPNMPKITESTIIKTKEETMSDDSNTLPVTTTTVATSLIPLTNGPSNVPDSLSLLESTAAYLATLVVSVENIAAQVNGYPISQNPNAVPTVKPSTLSVVVRLNNLVTQLNVLESDLATVKSSLESSFGITQ